MPSKILPFALRYKMDGVLEDSFTDFTEHEWKLLLNETDVILELTDRIRYALQQKQYDLAARMIDVWVMRITPVGRASETVGLIEGIRTLQELGD